MKILKSFLSTVLMILSIFPAANGFTQGKSGISDCRDYTKPVIIHFDFKEKRFFNLDALEKLKRGGLYQLVITNINTNLYQVSIDKTDSLEPQTFNFPTFAGLGTDGLSTLMANIIKSGGSISSGIANMKADMMAITESESSPGSIKTKNRDEEKTVLNRKLEILKRIESMNVYLKNTTHSLENISNSIAEINQKVILAVIQERLEFKTPERIRVSPYLDPLKGLADLLSEIETCQGDLKKMKDGMFGALLAYEDYMFANEDLVLKDDSLKNAGVRVKKNYADLYARIGEFQEKFNPENVNKILSALVNICNNRDNEYISLPQEFTKDRTSLSLNIEPRDTSLKLQKYHTDLIFPLKPRWFFGVSSGFFASWLYDEAYSVSSTRISDSLTHYTLVAENSGKWESGIAAMVHAGWKPFKKADLYIQGGFGPGVNISSKVRPRLLVGVGLAYGKKHKFLATAGMIFGFSERLSKAYETQKIYTKEPGNVTVSVMKGSWFVSLGYVFSL